MTETYTTERQRSGYFKWETNFGCYFQLIPIIEVNRKMKTFHINLLKQYVQIDSIQKTAAHRWRDFPVVTREETGVRTEIDVHRGEPLISSSRWNKQDCCTTKCGLC